MTEQPVTTAPQRLLVRLKDSPRWKRSIHHGALRSFTDAEHSFLTTSSPTHADLPENGIRDRGHPTEGPTMDRKLTGS